MQLFTHISCMLLEVAHVCEFLSYRYVRAHTCGMQCAIEKSGDQSAVEENGAHTTGVREARPRLQIYTPLLLSLPYFLPLCRLSLTLFLHETAILNISCKITALPSEYPIAFIRLFSSFPILTLSSSSFSPSFYYSLSCFSSPLYSFSLCSSSLYSSTPYPLVPSKRSTFCSMSCCLTIPSTFREDVTSDCRDALRTVYRRTEEKKCATQRELAIPE